MALSVYKKGQGTAARGVAGVVAAVLGVWAAHQMWYTFFGASVVVRVIGAVIAAALFGGAPIYLVLFHHQAVDILIETQQEMKKVAWSSRAEVFGSTLVVLATVILLAAFILSTDLVVNALFRLIGLFR